MIFQRIDAWGDSLTFGARTYGNYPLFLGQILRQETGLEWIVRNRGVNENTARELWFRVSETVASEPSRHVACVVIGTNDAKNLTDVKVFEEYYEQILAQLAANQWTVIACDIPLIISRGRLPYTKRAEAHRLTLNKAIARVTGRRNVLRVSVPLTADDLIDGVHLTERGNVRMAQAFAGAVLSL